MRLRGICFPSQAICIHTSQIKHGKCISLFCLSRKQTEGFLKIRLLLIASIETLTGYFIGITPLCIEIDIIVTWKFIVLRFIYHISSF